MTINKPDNAPRDINQKNLTTEKVVEFTGIPHVLFE